MATSFSNKSKNAPALSNKTKNSAAWDTKETPQPPAKFDQAQFDKSQFDEETRDEIWSSWQNKVKN